MKKLVVIAALVGTAAVAFAKGPQRAGNWHFTVTMEIPGMPAAPPPQTFDSCVTQAQSDDPKQAIKSQQGSKDCDPADIKLVGNKVTYTISCHMHGGLQKGTGEITYTGDSMSGTTTIEMANPRGSGTMKMVQHTVAQRTGDCVK